MVKGAIATGLASTVQAGEALASPSHDDGPLPPPRTDRLIIDAVAHSYNQHPSNRRNRLSSFNGAYDYHVLCCPPEHTLTAEQWARDWQPDEFIETMLLESTTDIVCMHSVPLFQYNLDGLVSNEKGAYLKQRYPDRVFWYGALDLGRPRDEVIALATELVAQGADGVKLYPTGFNDETGQATDWYMDDTQVAFPIFEHLRALGIQHVAIHKLVEYDHRTLMKKRPYGVNDIAGAARNFPDLMFHLVHAGWLLNEATILLMSEYENVTAVMEGPMLWPLFDPRRFNEMMYMYMTTVGSDRLLYSSAATNPHPRFVIEALEAHNAPEGTLFDYPLTQEDKDNIMGNNFARLHGLDIAATHAKLATDRFSTYRAENGLRRPWAAVRGDA